VPEGDTIWRTARALDAALAGSRVLRFDSTIVRVAVLARDLDVAGRTVERVEARGKHLLVHFSGGVVLHTHQGMHGRWSLCRPSRLVEPNRRGHAARIRIDTDRASALCHGAPVVELLSGIELREHRALVRLGPDLLAPSCDAVQARERLRARGELEIGVALLAQSALAGIGNVYKSELLFLCGVAPDTPVSGLDAAALDQLIETGRRLLQRNLGPGVRRTTSGLAAPPLHVYRRAGRPCPRCGCAIRRLVQGEAARATYFCPRCQPPCRDAGNPSS
jgi:endonuclease VIII